ncbi:hypothetical protein BN946_scf184884.g51 [Trametes cinnabarina]|uniref:Major facilitator superfamily (MFS) profile domain-containing protein n=1 Tax=Pycnoporus cinnabarinus TaxID=5643 RepID=A0A060S5Z9_PYCCI|nr:hypothetical protein BN946_scf184884.g51 [Trametes cinnabarina]
MTSNAPPSAHALAVILDEKAPKFEVTEIERTSLVHCEIIDEGASFDPVYTAKARILGDAFQEIGMGKYQWCLFCLTGLGWFSDNLWPIAAGLIIPPTVNEFQYQGAWLKFAQGIGSLVGSSFWGISSDIWGRRWSYNLTLFITGVFAMAAGASPNATTLCALVGAWNVGVGGNLPVDSAIFLGSSHTKFSPPSHQYLLTVLSIWWAVGQLVGSLVAWPLMANFSCASAADCPRASNQGWRYFLYAMGGLMTVLFFCRFLLFHLYESPKFLMSHGRDAEAVEVVHRVARFNGRTSSLTLEMLQEVDRAAAKAGAADAKGNKATLLGTLARFGGKHVKGLFATPKLALSTSILIILWALVGLGFNLYYGFLPYFLATRGADFGDGSVYITYRNQVILSVVGLPGALIGGWMVELPYLGRRGTLGLSTLVTGVFLMATTTSRSSNALLAWNCASTVTSNIMYGVLYAISPELFPAKDRGTGAALVACANHICGALVSSDVWNAG